MKIVLFFAEGPHDIAFIKLALRHRFHLSVNNQQKINSLPTPLNKIFDQLIKEHFWGDWSLDMAHKFLLPNNILNTNDGDFIFLFNTGGMNKYSVVKQLISRVFYQLKFGGLHYDFDIDDVRIIFTYDADYRGESRTIEEVKRHIFPIKAVDCKFDETGENDDETLLDSSSPNIFYYIWHGHVDYGTLEDILVPIYRQSHAVLFDKTDIFINENFKEYFDFDSTKITQHDIATKAKKNKALITIAGQGKYPSRPTTAIIEDNVLGNETTFIQDRFVSNFTNFLIQSKIFDS